MPADLHIHSTYSDGSLTPAEIVALAAQKGLLAIAITDHDSVEGVEPARQAAQNLNLEVLPGIEMSTEDGVQEVHILGYGLDFTDQVLRTLLAELRRGRWSRALAILERLKRLDKHLSPEDIAPADNRASVGRLHIAKALVKKGLVGHVEEAFSLYLNSGQPAYVPHDKFTPAQAIEVIRHHGGLPFLAHPGVSRCDHLIPGLIAAGLAGIEVFYSRHTPEQVGHYSQICRKNGLLLSGGSDFHGTASGAGFYPAEIGRAVISDKHWKMIVKALGRTDGDRAELVSQGLGQGRA